MSSRKWRSEACIDETSESSSGSAVSTPNTARARSPVMTPPPSWEEPRQGEEGPQQGEDPAMEVADDNLVRPSLSGDGVDGSGEATARPRTEGSRPSTSGVDASASAGDVASSGATGGVPEHPGNASEYRAQTRRLSNRDTLYLTRSGLSNHGI